MPAQAATVLLYLKRRRQLIRYTRYAQNKTLPLTPASWIALKGQSPWNNQTIKEYTTQLTNRLDFAVSVNGRAEG